MRKQRLRDRQFLFNAGLIVSIMMMYGVFAIIMYTSLLKYSEFVAVDAAKRSAEQLLTTRSIMAKLAPHITVDDELDPFAATPAAIGIAIGNEMSKKHGYYIKQTSKRYRNKMNLPDPTEEKMLEALEAGSDEIWIHEHDTPEDRLRYGRVLKVEDACMRCHGKPGVDVPMPVYEKLVERYGERGFNYEVGDVRGMISVIIPMEPFHKEAEELFYKIFVIGFITLLLVLLLLYLHNRFVIRPHIKLLTDSKEKLYHSAFRDPMTGMQNRRAFNDHIRENMDTFNRSFWLVFIDLDNFKTINDVYGHDAGDAVLMATATRLHALSPDSNAYRMGGDEFVMMVYNKNRGRDIAELLTKLVYEVRQPVQFHDENMLVGVSVGAAHYPTHTESVEPLIRHADLAMYSAKENGKNQFVIYDDKLLAEANAIQQMENDLEKALLNDEFFLLYQPQYDVKNEKIIGVEALLRWRHPKRGVLSPPAFISVAEASGMMLDIGRWILYEACRQNKEWQLRGFEPIRVSINVTSAQLEDLGFIMDLIDVVGETNLDPDYLEIEFIERSAINNEGNTIEFMNQLKMMKIHAAIDDFGTGYSSLSYISKFPIDKIKIDRMFIDKIHEREDNSTIVRSIISIAEHLGIEVLAEGVETKEELEFLANEGCYLIQGYYFSKPLPAEELEKRLS